MKIITYNVNGLRAAVTKGLPEWLANEQPDVLCLQETKLQPEQYPAEALDALGYKHYLYSARKKGYSGVAILTKREPDHVEDGMGMEEYDSEGRFMRADYGDLSIVSVYHPSGTSGDERQAFKMVWLEKFRQYVVKLQRTRPKLILCGDYNICHEAIDIHDPVRNATNSGFLPEEREWMTRFLNEGFIDTFRLLHPDKQEYTWWSYRFNSRAKNKGWRIDYCMVNEPVRPMLKDARILNDAVHSDHCPMMLELADCEMTNDRIEKAVGLFKSGYNCSQSVVAAFADMYGFTEEQALRMSASFGGGIGRMRQTCGAACGMFLLAGLEKGAVDGKDREGKAANYALVQELAEEFKKRNGSMICAELLGLKKPEGSSTPEARTEQYYAKRPCAKMVEEAATIWAEYLEKQQK